MAERRFYTIALIFLVFVLGYFSYEIFKPFLSPIAWAIVLSIVFYPIYVFILKLVKRKSLASFITLLIILAIILGPFSYLSYLLTQELNALADHLEGGSFDPMKNVLLHPVVNKIIHTILSLFNITEAGFQKTITDGISRLGRESVGIISSGLGNVVTAALDFVFMILSIFFLLGDGPELLEKVSSYMPLSKKQKDKLIKQMRDIVISTIYGGILVGIFVISMVDNILRPLIIRGKMKMPTLAIFFSILGGIKLFGFIGLIMGPLVLALFVSVVEILRYTEEEQKMG
ncbi:MAG: AI-2E family transporter [Proteobacteria bacterium]|nr:AI-2E family transporter [Pseudomonadota bacterium]